MSNVSDENEGFKTPKGRHRRTSTDHSSDQSTPGSSRQNLLGIKIRKKNNKDKNRKIEELVKENNDLKFIQDKHDDELSVLDFRIHELQAANENLKMENESLKKDKEKNDDEWFGEIYKNLSSKCVE